MLRDFLRMLCLSYPAGDVCHQSQDMHGCDSVISLDLYLNLVLKEISLLLEFN